MINIILFLNYTVKIAERSETYKIDWVYNYNNKSEVLIAGMDEEMGIKINNFLTEGKKDVSEHAKTITVVYYKGLFGFEMIGDCKFK